MKAAIRRWPWATAIIAALAVSVFAWPGAPAALLLDREAVRHGELWRCWTGHLVHFGASHLGWNLVVFLVAGAWLEFVAAARARIYFILAPALIAAVLLGFEPALESYGGLSGVTAGAVALLALTQLANGLREDRWFWCAVLILLGIKIAAEFFLEKAPFARFAAADIQVVPLAHLAGVACAGVIFFTRRTRRESAP